MAGEVSAILQLVKYTYDFGRYIQRFADSVNNHEKRVKDLCDRIELHSGLLRSAHDVYERIKDDPDPGIQNSARNILKRAKSSHESLIKLTQIKEDWEDADNSLFKRALENWIYEEEGGKGDFEAAVNFIREMEAGITNQLGAVTVMIHRPKKIEAQEKSGLVVGEKEVQGDDEMKLERKPQSLSVALIKAIKTKTPKPVKLRLEAGDSVLASDHNRCNALHHAVKAGGSRVLDALLACDEVKKNRQGLNRLDKDGESPLHLALRLGKVEIMDKLLKAKADVNVKDKYERTCLDIALKAGKDNIVELLLKHKANETFLIKPSREIKERLAEIKQFLKL